MERYTICVTAKEYQFFISRFAFERLSAAIEWAMGVSPNGSAKVTLIEGTKSTGDVVASWYPKTRKSEWRLDVAENVTRKVEAAIAELRKS